MLVLSFLFVFFKQKTAYEMRISDWSSDVCSSDLVQAIAISRFSGEENRKMKTFYLAGFVAAASMLAVPALAVQQDKNGQPVKEKKVCRSQQATGKIGRASCRERVCKYV